MVSEINDFTRVLIKHERNVLQDAFDKANRRATFGSYNRTTLGRWLKGSVPNRRDFIVELAAALNDNELVEAWDRIKNCRSSNLTQIRNRVRSLPLEEKNIVLDSIKNEVFSKHPLLRSQYSLRVEICDSAVKNYLEVRPTLSFTGALPENAFFLLSRDSATVQKNFEVENCIFRAKLDGEAEMTALLGQPQYSRQYISYTDLDSTDAPFTLEAEQVEPGLFQFTNKSVKRAQIKINSRYPFPFGNKIWYVKTENPVFGAVEATFVLNSSRTHTPRCLATFGNQVHYTSEVLHGSELNSRVGEPSEIAESSALLFTWLED